MSAEQNRRRARRTIASLRRTRNLYDKGSTMRDAKVVEHPSKVKKHASAAEAYNRPEGAPKMVAGPEPKPQHPGVPNPSLQPPIQSAKKKVPEQMQPGSPAVNDAKIAPPKVTGDVPSEKDKFEQGMADAGPMNAGLPKATRDKDDEERDKDLFPDNAHSQEGPRDKNDEEENKELFPTNADGSEPPRTPEPPEPPRVPEVKDDEDENKESFKCGYEHEEDGKMKPSSPTSVTPPGP